MQHLSDSTTIKRVWILFAALPILLLSLASVAFARVSPDAPLGSGPAHQNPELCSADFISVSQPLNDLGPNEYVRMDSGPTGFFGGLYPNGSNTRPTAHDQAGYEIANSIGPLDQSGAPDSEGKIVMASIGFSNAYHEFNLFEQMAGADPATNESLVFVNGGIAGKTSDNWADINDDAWNMLLEALANADVTDNQVQVVWFKFARIGYFDFPGGALDVQSDVESTVRNLKAVLPNIKIVYLASRTRSYAYWDGTSPEPTAFETGFSGKWAIEKQIDGDPALNYDAKVGAVMAPYLSWGPYLWIDGLNPRSDGLKWLQTDLIADCAHPSDSGLDKVADQMLSFFKTDLTTLFWFLEQPEPSLLSPPVGAANVPVKPAFTWTAVGHAVGYTIEIATDANFNTIVLSDTVNSNSYMAETALADSVPYFWRVRANYLYGSGDNSTPFSFTSTSQPSPLLLSLPDGATNVPTKPTFTWSPVSNALSYTIEIATDANFDDDVVSDMVSGTSFTPNVDLANSVPHFWRVRANYRYGSGSDSAVFSLTPIPALGPVLLTPHDGAANVPTKPTFSWAPVSQALNYTIEIATDANFNSMVLSQTVFDSSFTPGTDLDISVTHFWRVRANYIYATGSNSTAFSFTPIPTLGPALLTPPDGAANVPSKPAFTWSPVSEALTYDIEIATDANFNTLVLAEGANGDSFETEIELAASAPHFWRVRANYLNATGNYSMVFGFIPFLTVEPELLTPSDGAENLQTMPAFAWSPVTEAINYTIEIAADADFDNLVLVETVDGTLFLPDTGFVSGAPHFWRVRANYLYGSGIDSATFSFTVGQSYYLPLLVRSAAN